MSGEKKETKRGAITQQLILYDENRQLCTTPCQSEGDRRPPLLQKLNMKFRPRRRHGRPPNRHGNPQIPQRETARPRPAAVARASAGLVLTRPILATRRERSSRPSLFFSSLHSLTTIRSSLSLPLFPHFRPSSALFCPLLHSSSSLSCLP